MKQYGINHKKGSIPQHFHKGLVEHCIKISDVKKVLY